MSKICLVGHSHIDAVYIWDRKEAKDILNKTFYNVLNLMDVNPDLTFVQSSAQFYSWIENENPGLFNRIKEKIEQGRWEIVGGMWVEPDCNIPSGESLIRQVLYGM